MNQREQKVHFFRNNGGKLNRRGNRPVDNTACESNHGDLTLKVTDDPKQVTCKRCLLKIEGKNWMGRQLKGFNVQAMQATIDAQRVEIEAIRHELSLAKAECARLDKRAGEKHDAWVASERKAEQYLAEGNELRRAIHEAELDRERMRGYMDAVEDHRPPRMVEEQRERHFGRYTRMSPMESDMYQHYGKAERPKRWFER